jgi:hypothetical protein
MFFCVIALFFVPAETLDFGEAWVFLAIFFISTIIFSIYYEKHRSGAGGIANAEPREGEEQK